MLRTTPIYWKLPCVGGNRWRGVFCSGHAQMSFLRVAAGTALLLWSVADAGDLHPYLAKFTGSDSTRNVWVVFRDKPSGLGKVAVTARAFARRRRVGFPSTPAHVYQERPVSREYVETVIARGAGLRHICRWENTASFSVRCKRLPELASLPFVKKVVPVASATGRLPAPLKKRRVEGTRVVQGTYGEAWRQLSIVGLPQAQTYIQARTGRAPGDGVTVAVFDAGFRLDHPCFGYVNENAKVVDDSDFVDRDGDPYVDDDDHGAQVTALISGYDPGSFMGAAWGVNLILARTELHMIDGALMEWRCEEDNWYAAVEWAELRADVITSSVGYRWEFTDSLGAPDTSLDHKDWEMNGVTTRVARAAQLAFERGVVVVNAMGNDNIMYGPYGSLCSPADVEDVMSVGAVTFGRTIDPFSSTGPTADGRIKPDLVAPGVSVYVPSRDYYTTGSGTSFATPLVAGIVALVNQMYPGDTNFVLRDRVYGSCSFASTQDTVDNVYGRGIPDALLACIGPDSGYLFVLDPFGRAIDSVVVSDSAGGVRGATDRNGLLVLHVDSTASPDTLSVQHNLYVPGKMVIGVNKRATTITLEPESTACVVVVSLVDSSIGAEVGPVRGGTVYYGHRGDEERESLSADSNGSVQFCGAVGEEYEVYARADGYRHSATRVVLLDAAECWVTVVLRPYSVSDFVLYPTVVNFAGGTHELHVEFVASKVSELGHSGVVHATVRTATGDLVWEQVVDAAGGEPVVVTWNCMARGGSRAARGVYLFSLTFAGRTHIRKFMITG